MTVAEPLPAAPKPTVRWLRLTPGRCLAAFLAVECLLWLSAWFHWPTWHKGYAVVIAVTTASVVLLLILLWFGASLLFRWQFQINIRSFLVLAVAVLIPFSWLTMEEERAWRQREVVNEIRNAGGYVSYAWEVDASGRGRLLPKAQEPRPTWLRNLLGDDLFAGILSVSFDRPNVTDYLGSTNVTDAGLRHVKGLPDLQYLILIDSQVTDKGLQDLEGLTQLEGLWLDNTQVTDKGLEHVKGLTQLETLALRNTRVTDAGLQHLKGLTQLKDLDLLGTKVTDVGLVYLKGLTKLQFLGLWGSKVSGDGVDGIQKVLPNCLVTGPPHKEGEGIEQLKK
jgi:hypothetical protein